MSPRHRKKGTNWKQKVNWNPIIWHGTLLAHNGRRQKKTIQKCMDLATREKGTNERGYTRQFCRFLGHQTFQRPETVTWGFDKQDSSLRLQVDRGDEIETPFADQTEEGI